MARMSWLRRGIAAAFLLGLSHPAHALCGNGLASEDLTNECLLGVYQTLRIPSERAALNSLLTTRLTAAGHDRSIGITARVAQPKPRVTVRPVIEYSRNLNGGELDSPLVLGGLSFNFDPEVQRRAGLAVGAELGVAQRMLLRNGRRMDLSATVTATHAPEEDLTQFRAQAAACPVWRLNRAWRLDGCLQALHVERDLSRDTAIVQSTGLTYFLRQPGGVGSTAFRIGLDRRLEDDLDQRSLRLSAETMLPGDFVGSAALGWGRGEEGQFVAERSLGLTLAGRVAGRDMRLRYSRIEEGGANILGLPRSDTRDVIGLDIGVTRSVALQLGYHRRKSSISSFDESYPTVGLRLQALSF